MRLSELMAAVRMTPIKEREKEEGLGDTEVAVDYYHGGEASARKRTVVQQEEEIRHWEAMLTAEEDEKRQKSETVSTVASEADCFHTASELDFEFTELQQLSHADDDRRSSLFAAIPLPAPVEWLDSSDVPTPSADDGATFDSTLPLPALESLDEDSAASVEDSEIELQQRNAAADVNKEAAPHDSEIELQKYSNDETDDLQLTDSSLTTPQPNTNTDDINSPVDVQSDDTVDSIPAEQEETVEQLYESTVCDMPVEVVLLQAEDGHVEAEAEDVMETVADEASLFEVDECSEQTSSSDFTPLPPSSEPHLSSPPSPSSSAAPPCPSCTSCSTLFASLHNYQTSCERQSWQIQRLLDEQSAQALETDAKLQKEDDDYKSLYAAYCQLERQHNALKARHRTEPENADDNPEEEQQDVEDSAAEAAVDYAAMSEEKVVPAKSPSVPLVDQLTAELEQLRMTQAAAEAQVEMRMAAAEAEAAELSDKYDQLRQEYSTQSELLVDALRTVEEMKLAQARLGETNEMRMQEKEQQFQHPDSHKQQLAADLQSSQQQLEQLTIRLQALDADNHKLTTSLTTLQLETFQLQAQLSEQRDTTEYVHNEKLALEQELFDLHTTHTALSTQHATNQQQYETLVAQHQQRDTDMLSVIDDSIANIEQLRIQLSNTTLAFTRCHHTLLERCDEDTVRSEELYAVRIELQQTGAELALEVERVAGLAAQLTEADGMRAALESRLRRSEDRVEELTALMATVEQDRKKDKHIHTTLTTQLCEADRQLEEQRTKSRELAKQTRQAEDRTVRLEGDLAMQEQKHVRLQSELQRERDERRREMERRRETEAQLDQLQQHTAALEGQQEALTQSIQLRPQGVTDEYERRLRDKEALILRLGKTVKQMHRHIEVDVAQREAEMARTIRQQQRLFVLVVKILSKPQYATDNEVRRLLEVLERENAAIGTRGKEEAKESVG